MARIGKSKGKRDATGRMPLQSWRPTPEDKKLLIELQAKLGVSETDILRLGIRELAKAHLPA